MQKQQAMNKSTLQDCLACFERFDIDAELEDDGTIHVMTSNPDVYVQISKQEIIWRADQHLELLKQEQES
jgi:hypothetical protein